MLFVNPVTSDDYYRYLWDGKVQSEGINPYQYTPEELPSLHDKFIYPKVTYPDIKTIYPPVAEIIFYSGYIFSDNTALGFKLIYLLFEFGTIYFLFLTVRFLKINSNYIFLYVLSPLVIFEFFINAHIDVIILFFLSAFIYFALTKNTGAAFLFLSISILSKTYSLIFLPLYIIHLYNSGMRIRNIFLNSFYLFLPLLLLSYYGNSIFNMFDVMGNYMQHWYFNNLIFLSIEEFLNFTFTDDHLFARIILILFFLVSYLAILKSNYEFTLKLYLTAFSYLLFSHTVHQWYITLPVLFLPVCFSYSALYWSGIAGLTNLTVYYFLKDNIWEDFLPALIAEYVILIVLIFYDLKLFKSNFVNPDLKVHNE